jgi:hypothetical protein
MARWTGDGGYWLRIAPGQRVAALRNLNMNGGGVEIEGNVRKHWGFYDCTFKDAPEWAIKTLGPSVIGGTFNRLTLAENANGIYFAHEQSDVNVLNCVAFLNIPGTALRLRTSGIHAYDIDFERCGLSIHLDEDYPDVAYGDIRFSRVRFGNESPSPKYEVLVGRDENTTNHAMIADVVFSDCMFRSTPRNENEGRAVLKLMNPVNEMQFIGCKFWPGYKLFAEEDYFPAVGARNVKSNVIIGSQPPQDFSHGGVGWTQIPSENEHVSVKSEKDITNIFSWQKDDVTVAQDALSPENIEDAYTITRTDAGNSSIRKYVKQLDDEYEHYTFSVWARMVDEDVMRLACLTANNKWVYLNKPIKLIKRWRQYWITVPSKAMADVMSVYILIGTETDGKSTGQIEVWNPQITYGKKPI